MKMKMTKLFSMLLAISLLFNISCTEDDPIVTPKGAYENGFLVANEGNFGSPNASVSFISKDLSTIENNIFSSNNSNAALGDVLQSIGFKGDYAYMVLNNSNKIVVADRYNFKKFGEITENLVSPRYTAFSGNSTYVTNNNFFDVMKVNIYNESNGFVSSINFDRYAEKIVSSNGFVYVQTDGVTYDANYNELPTGHTISRINPNTNSLDKTINLTDAAIIRDMIADNNFIYVLTSDNTSSFLYKITSNTGVFEKIELTGVTNAKNIANDNGIIYFLTATNKVYAMNGNSSNFLFDATANYAYGFNVINGNIFVADASFTENSVIRIYNNSGSILKTYTTGRGTNGFYQN